MEEEYLLSMNVVDIEFLAPLYPKKILVDLLTYLKSNVSSA